jgi:F0F1-type ATP synthase membrane subunit b/b'
MIATAGIIYYALPEYEHLILITKLWEVPQEEIVKGFSLIEIKGEISTFYTLKTATSFYDIAKHLWLVGALFLSIISLILPLSIYALKTFFNQELSEAKEAKQEASNAIKKCENECGLKVEQAYKKQLTRVQITLSAQKKGIEEREKRIADREATAERKISETEALRVQYSAQFEILKSDFEKTVKLFSKSRNNAVATMNRRKRKINK